MTKPLHPSLTQRKIIHIDMDCFYAAVEVRDNPSLRGLPVIVGGSPQSRGVVATCSYEARRFGVHSAMSCSRAYRLCPQAVFVRPHFEKYRAVSEQIREIFRGYTSLVEPLSLDEAYLDVTGHELYATQVAEAIRQDIFMKTALTASAGVAPNKMVAKIASDIHKPDGLTVVRPEQVEGFMKPLPLRKISGVGPATERKLLQYGLKLCGDVWQHELEVLEARLGKRMAGWLFKRSRGIDERSVETQWVRKSLGSEDTFARDLLDVEKIHQEIRRISISVASSLQKNVLEVVQ